MIHLFLFDVDGVLTDAHGYLKALQNTVAHFSRRMGVGNLPPTEEEARAFEAYGLTSEWDSGPTCVAALLLERLRQDSCPPLPPHWPAALSLLATHPHPLPHPDYTALAQRVGQHLDGQTSPAQAAYVTLWDQVEAIPSLEAHRPTLSVLLDTLLGHTNDFFRAPITRHFQHLVIGSQGVTETYGIAPDFASPAYLHHYDQPLLTPNTYARLHEASIGKQTRIAIYTARPSLPPVEVNESTNGYSPEAEMARSLVGLEAWPLIGLGRIRWLAHQAGERVERLIKPCSVQALAAIGAAWSGQETAALDAALALHRDGELRPPLTGMEPVTLHVFEDTTGGLEAARRGVEELRTAGLAIEWQPYGITPADGPKAAAMAARGVPTYPSVNEATLAALG
ncbi:MAG: hypothetical protein SWK90_15850 [Chloroflexota bacterium]|nr:hypothetical protein [Chloroflexota bacterium]